MEMTAKIKESTESTIFTFVDKSMKFSPFFRLRHGSALYLQDRSEREECQLILLNHQIAEISTKDTAGKDSNVRA